MNYNIKSVLYLCLTETLDTIPIYMNMTKVLEVERALYNLQGFSWLAQSEQGKRPTGAHLPMALNFGLEFLDKMLVTVKILNIGTYMSEQTV